MRATITGYGVVTAFGRGVERLWSAMAAGEQGIRAIERFSTTEFDVGIAGMVADRNDRAWWDRYEELCVDFAIAAAREAIGAGLDARPERIAFVIGTSLGDYRRPMHQISEEIALAIGARGACITVSTACTSSANALGIGLDLLEQDAADAVIAGGADVMSPLVLGGFHRLGVLSAQPCAPFSSPPGTSLGEGAGFVVLRRDGAGRFGLYGYGLSGDAYHETGPDPSGLGVARAMRCALVHAGVDASVIDYVNAHGTGTVAGDPAEWRAMKHVLGDRAASVPVSSSKSFLGHAQGAAGVVELIATLVAIEHGTIPPTRNFVGARPNSPPDPVASDVPRAATVAHALCNSSGFGGANCAIVIGPAGETSAPLARRDVFVAGIGAAGIAADLGIEARAGIVADPRGLDPMTRDLVAASSIALADAGVKLRGAMHERSGLVVGTTRVSKDSEAALRRSIDERGLRNLSAAMFSRMVLNAPAGACAKQLVLKGPLSTVSAGDASGLVAIATAAHLLAARDDADLIIAGGVEEDRRTPDVPTIAGAAMVVLTTTPSPIRLAAWRLGGPTDALACARAAIGSFTIDLAIGPPFDLGVSTWRRPEARAGSASSPLALALGVAAIRRGEARTVLVVAELGSSSCALVLEGALP